MFSALSKRARIAIVVVLLVAALGWLVAARRNNSKTTDPFDAVPRDAFLVATVNVAELRRSPLYDVLLGKDSSSIGTTGGSVLDRRALGLGKLGDACGFDPLTRVDTLALGVPEDGDKGELGVAARIAVTDGELEKCTTNLAGQRGGKVETTDIGGFTVVEDSSSQEPARPRLGYGHGGLLVVGRGTWFEAMLATADGKRPGVKDAPVHAAMRAALKSHEGWGAPSVIVTALLPRTLRERIKTEMGIEVGDKAQGDSQAIMAGVLGVSSLGVALKAGASGGSTEGAVELACDTEEGCVSVEKLISKKRFEWSKELTLRMVGFGSLLDSIEVKREGARIRVTAGASADGLATTIDRVLRLKARSHGREPDREPPPAPPGAPLATAVAHPVDAGASSPSAPTAGAAREKLERPERGENIPAPKPSH